MNDMELMIPFGKHTLKFPLILYFAMIRGYKLGSLHGFFLPEKQEHENIEYQFA